MQRDITLQEELFLETMSYLAKRGLCEDVYWTEDFVPYFISNDFFTHASFFAEDVTTLDDLEIIKSIAEKEPFYLPELYIAYKTKRVPIDRAMQSLSSDVLALFNEIVTWS